MTNIAELEREWKEYKNKQRRPIYLGVSIVFLIILVVIFTFNAINETTSDATEAKLKTPNKIAVVEKQILDTNTSKKTIVPKQAQELKPSFAFMKQIKTKPYKKSKKVQKRKQAKKVTQQRVYKKSKRVTKNSHSIAVTSTSAQSKLSSLIKRFNNNRNPILGLTIAKQYLELKNYRQSYFYALEVNNIDQSIEDSWLITAQSLYFLKKKETAMKLLENYLKSHSSAKAVKLYRSIKQDRLK